EEEGAEDHAAASALDRRRNLAGVATRQHYLVPRDGLVGDVRARVTCAHHENPAVLELPQVAVGARMDLRDLGAELVRERWDERLLEDAGGDDDRLRLDPRSAGVSHEAAAFLRQRLDTGSEPDGQLEARRIGLEIVRHLVLGGIRRSAGWER